MNPTHFFVFSIGPVQGFIAQARKAQDLYMGCRMVSDYCRYAAMTFKEKGGETIFPNIESNSITNRFVGTVSVADEAEARAIGEAIEDTVKARFVEEGMAAIRAGLDGFDPSKVKGMKEQLETHLETYWAFSLYDESNYAQSFRRAEQVFGMSKYMRTPRPMAYQSALPGYYVFGPDFLGETGRKCAVDGERNVKVYRWSEGDRNSKYHSTPGDLLKNKLFIDNRDEAVLIGRKEELDNVSFVIKKDHEFLKFTQPGEGLSAVSFFKRCYKPDQVEIMMENIDAWKEKYKTNAAEEESFLSTALVAVHDCIEQVQKNSSEVWTNLEKYLNKYDDEFIFSENCTTNTLQKYGISDTEGESIIKAQKAFQDEVKNQNATLQPYYTLMAIDIDNLGKYMAHQIRDGHEDIAQKLNLFAGYVDTITHIGLERTLHAGGDDFLLMLNLQHLFRVLKTIKDAWNSLQLPLTYSTAIIISHYKAPLTRAVKTAKAELQAAKDRFTDKDAVACCFMTKSGAVTTTYFKQGKLCRFCELFHALQTKQYSPKFIFQFAQNMADMGFHGDTTQKEQERIRQFAEWELQRLMVRARDTKKVEKKEAGEFAQALAPLLLEQVRDAGNHLDLDNFTRFLKMAELAAKHTNLWPHNEDTSE